MQSPNLTFWDHRVFLTAPGAVLIDVGEVSILFDEAAQTLAELNQGSALLWQGLALQFTLADTARSMAISDSDLDTFMIFARSLLMEWLRAGLVTPVFPARSESQPRRRYTFGWMNRSIELDVDGALDVSPVLDIFATFLMDAVPNRVFELDVIGDLIFIRDDAGGGRARSTVEWVAEIKALFTTEFLTTDVAGFAIHAALVSRGDEGVLICGDPGAGKSTLTMSLIQDQFHYHSDDIVWLSETGRATGAPFSPALKEGSWPLVLQMKGLMTLSSPYIRGDGQAVRYASSPVWRADDVPIGTIILLSRDLVSPARLDPVSPVEAITTILRSSYSAKRILPISELEALVAVVKRAKLGRLVFSNWSDASTAISTFSP